MGTRPDAIYDELLVLRCQEGDPKALEELVERWQSRLWRHANHLTGRPEVAWDIVQEAWMAIVRGIRRLDDPARFRQWSYRIVSNKCTDWMRRQHRQRKLVEDVSHEVQEGATDSADQASGDDDVDRLRQALRRLPKDRQTILAMLYLDGMSIAEIASVLAIPEGTVKSRLHQARNHLRTILEGKS